MGLYRDTLTLESFQSNLENRKGISLHLEDLQSWNLIEKNICNNRSEETDRHTKVCIDTVTYKHRHWYIRLLLKHIQWEMENKSPVKCASWKAPYVDHAQTLPHQHSALKRRFSHSINFSSLRCNLSLCPCLNAPHEVFIRIVQWCLKAPIKRTLFGKGTPLSGGR